MDDADDTLKRQVGDGIRKARAAKKWTQRQLAELSGVAQDKISQYEQGRYLPAVDKLYAIDRACNQPLGYTQRLAGTIEETGDILSLIAADPRLNSKPDLREAILAIYRRGIEGHVADAVATVTAELAAETAPTRRHRRGPARSA